MWSSMWPSSSARIASRSRRVSRFREADTAWMYSLRVMGIPPLCAAGHRRHDTAGLVIGSGPPEIQSPPVALELLAHQEIGRSPVRHPRAPGGREAGGVLPVLPAADLKFQALDVRVIHAAEEVVYSLPILAVCSPAGEKIFLHIQGFPCIA